MGFSRHLMEPKMPHSVTLSAAKGLTRWGTRSFALLSMTGMCSFCATLLLSKKCRYIIISAEASVTSCFFAKLIFDGEQAVILGYTFAARRCTRLDLSSIGGNYEVGNGCIFSFAGTMGDDGGKRGTFGHLDGFKCLG